MIRRCVLSAALLTLVLVPAANAASSLSLKRGKANITAVFRQELADATATAVTSKVGPCVKTNRRTVVCDTSARMNADGQSIRCTKYYRARLVRGRVSVTESATGSNWRRHARSRCVTA